MKYKEIILLKFSCKPTNYCNPATLTCDDCKDTRLLSRVSGFNCCMRISIITRGSEIVLYSSLEELLYTMTSFL